MESRFHHILQLVKIMLVLPVHTAEVERGFSQMNIIKTKLRSSLQPESLASLLTVKLSKQDTINEEFTDDEETNGSVLGQNTWDS